ncbi:MAG: dihydrofolate reductase family protein [Planktothrix sp. GU0601_MAG3]|nr:MAG: dihydrofolate reductase family protein [Planktothrix sp. GU0601_MAG3]
MWCLLQERLTPIAVFFNSLFPHWLLTTNQGKQLWENIAGFENIIIADNNHHQINWSLAFEQLQKLGLNKLGILGGGQLVASLLKQNLIDQFWLTICPLILSGKNSPTPADGEGFLSTVAPRLQLLEVKTLGQEVFLHYQVLTDQ